MQFVYSLQVTCTAGALVPTPVCLGDSCTVPKLQNGEYTKVSISPTFCVFGGQSAGQSPPILRNLSRCPQLEAFKWKILRKAAKKRKNDESTGCSKKIRLLTHLISECQWDFLICFTHY